MGLRWRKFCKVLGDFLENSSCHGLNQIQISKKLQATAWLTCTLLVAAICSVHLANIVAELEKKEVIVQLLVGIF